MNFILFIRGGLGNQLFQYATMRLLSVLHPGSQMFVDRKGYKNYKVRDFELDSFRLIEKTRDYTESPLLYAISRKSYHLYQYCFQKATGWQAPMVGTFFQRKGLVYATIDYTMPEELSEENNFLYGYFAKFEYINAIRDILVEEVQLKNGLSYKAQKYFDSINSAEHPVGVSIRYGKDYKNLGWPICRPDYYRAGMDKIKAERGNCKFFVFCDVIDEIQREKWFDNYDVEYVMGLSVAESFTLLKSCDDFVIPNSSFSVWAAYLCKNPNKIVYAPNYFYTEKYKHKYDRLIHFPGERFLDYKNGQETDNF